MHSSPELVALIQREREQHINQDQLARLAACARACCESGRFQRIARALRGTPAAC